ncbi:MAG: SpoIID/LytB domain-containing protein [Lachnospiraceae bacterium]|nr:SpoIID/LytB domain-containing protein [Lachnospiraceae bacterium]
MKRKKIIARLTVALELTLLAGAIFFSFYLLYGYLREGEQAISDTAPEASGDTDESQTGRYEASGDTGESQTGRHEASGNAGESQLEMYEIGTTDIRVRILDDGYESDLFGEIAVAGRTGFTVEKGTYAEDYSFVSVTQEDEDACMALVQMSEAGYTVRASGLLVGEAVRIMPAGGDGLCVTSLNRSCGTPVYKGALYIYRLEDGLALVNVLDLETYLYTVVSSEMYSSFPLEAQKAQAVCSRTYAVQCIDRCKSEKTIADLDDSVRFQVYNNCQSTELSVEAVDSTCGEIISTDAIQYYSTSCLSEHREDLWEEEAFREFLQGVPDGGAEYGSAWLRWQVEIPAAQILETLAEKYGVLAEELRDVSVATRSGNGQAELLRIVTEQGTVDVEGEYEIRQILFPGKAEAVLMDGTTVSDMLLLPSAFFYVDMIQISESAGMETDLRCVQRQNVLSIPIRFAQGSVGYVRTEQNQGGADADVVLRVCGGGYGHGNGMSQYGAAQMASEGASFQEILEYYYGTAAG